MKSFFSCNRGITLASLVVSIIVLTILTSITVLYLTDDQGLINSAKNEKKKVEQTTSITENHINELKEGLRAS